MQVRVKLFATLSRHVPGAKPGVSFEADVPDAATLDDLVKRLSLPAAEVKVVFVNGRARPLDWRLGAGDEIGVFPPIGGG